MIEGSCHCGDVCWQFDGVPDSATACNCTICRRYGVLWAYGYEDEEDPCFWADSSLYSGRIDRLPFLSKMRLCGILAFAGSWCRWAASHRRQPSSHETPPETVADLPIEHFDGLNSFEDLGRDGRTVVDYWF